MRAIASMRHFQLTYLAIETRLYRRNERRLRVLLADMPHMFADRFELKELLGRGGMGEVHRAIDVQTGQHVAVKATPTEICARCQSAATFPS